VILPPKGDVRLARAKPTPGACADSIAQFFGKVYNYFFVVLCKIFSRTEKWAEVRKMDAQIFPKSVAPFRKKCYNGGYSMDKLGHHANLRRR
jgi:hypothetical protein